MICTRFAPSPTGSMHIGGLRTALYSYAFAKQNKGRFILRIEDTDRERFVKGATEGLIEVMKEYGLSWDEGPDVGGPHEPYIQSERVQSGIYQEAAEKLVEDGHAYYSFVKRESVEEIHARREKEHGIQRDLSSRNLSPEEVKKRLEAGEKAAIRLKVPEGEEVGYDDPIAKKYIKWNTSDVPDAVLLKSDGFPTYHLAVVVDDHAMGVTHIIRGHDWIPSTPIHLLLYKHFGYEVPEIMHLTDILDPDGGKLSKRKGSVTCEQFLADGHLPEAVLNFIMLLGWAPKDNREFFTLEEFVEHFDLKGLQKSNPVFNRKKLEWFNGQYLQNLSDKEFMTKSIEWMKKYKADDPVVSKIEKQKDRLEELFGLLKTRIKVFAAVPEALEFVFDRKEVPDLSEIKPLKGLTSEQFKEAQGKLYELFKEYPSEDNWTHEKWEADIRSLADKLGWKHGQLFMFLRVLITYSTASPPLFESMHLLGKKEVLSRLQKNS